VRRPTEMMRMWFRNACGTLTPEGRKRRALRGEEGTELVEFALSAWLLFILVFGLVELCLVLFSYNTAAEAAKHSPLALCSGSERVRRHGYLGRHYHPRTGDSRRRADDTDGQLVHKLDNLLSHSNFCQYRSRKLGPGASAICICECPVHIKKLTYRDQHISDGDLAITREVSASRPRGQGSGSSLCSWRQTALRTATSPEPAAWA